MERRKYTRDCKEAAAARAEREDKTVRQAARESCVNAGMPAEHTTVPPLTAACMSGRPREGLLFHSDRGCSTARRLSESACRGCAPRSGRA